MIALVSVLLVLTAGLAGALAAAVCRGRFSGAAPAARNGALPPRHP